MPPRDLSIDNWRWTGVPFYIRTGKCLPATVTEVVAEFRRPPRETFGEDISGLSNHLRLRLSPNVVIAIGMRVKMAGERMAGEDVELIATQRPRQEMSPYERLLGDALEGDQSLFARQDAIEAQWAIVEPVLGNVSPLYVYEPNTWGPAGADQITATSGSWCDPIANNEMQGAG
jgi:glucose-6-phosphate 1-dehydrogenase